MTYSKDQKAISYTANYNLLGKIVLSALVSNTNSDSTIDIIPWRGMWQNSRYVKQFYHRPTDRVINYQGQLYRKKYQKTIASKTCVPYPNGLHNNLKLWKKPCNILVQASYHMRFVFQRQIVILHKIARSTTYIFEVWLM